MCGVNVKYDLKGKKLHLLKKNVKKKKRRCWEKELELCGDIYGGTDFRVN